MTSIPRRILNLSMHNQFPAILVAALLCALALGTGCSNNRHPEPPASHQGTYPDECDYAGECTEPPPPPPPPPPAPFTCADSCNVRKDCGYLEPFPDSYDLCVEDCELRPDIDNFNACHQQHKDDCMLDTCD